jgi:hypothetical protein
MPFSTHTHRVTSAHIVLHSEQQRRSKNVEPFGEPLWWTGSICCCVILLSFFLCCWIFSAAQNRTHNFWRRFLFSLIYIQLSNSIYECKSEGKKSEQKRAVSNCHRRILLKILLMYRFLPSKVSVFNGNKQVNKKNWKMEGPQEQKTT